MLPAMVDQRPPVQTSAVYLLGASQFPAIPPPSPPSPVTPEASDLCNPIEELNLDDTDADPSSNAIPACTNNSATTNGTCNSTSSPPLDDIIPTAIHVLNTEAAALHSLSWLYATDSFAREAFHRSVSAITALYPSPYGPGRRGKLVIIGIGKSGHIGRKLAATFNSLSLPSLFLQAAEAMHGDLGVIDGERDALLLISYSGSTPEVADLLPHLDNDNEDIPTILLTGHHARSGGERCELVRRRHRYQTSNNNSNNKSKIIVLPAPVHELETTSFGVAAPTTSTTAALAVGDALAIVVANVVHPGKVSTVFKRNHPGGAIGAAAAKGAGVTAANTTSISPTSESSGSSSSRSRSSRSSSSSNSSSGSSSSSGAGAGAGAGYTKHPSCSSAAVASGHAVTGVPLVRHVSIPWEEIPLAIPEAVTQHPPPAGHHRSDFLLPRQSGIITTGFDVLRTGYTSPNGWVRVSTSGCGSGVIPPSRIRGLTSKDLSRSIEDILGLVVRRKDFVEVNGNETVGVTRERARDMRKRRMCEGVGDDFGIIAVMDGNWAECVGVLEVEALLEEGQIER